MANADPTPESEESPKVTSVATTVLTAFFDELSKLEDYAETAVNLKKLVLEDGVFAEPSVRAALFPDAP